MYTLNEKAMDAWFWAQQKGINVGLIEEIVEVLHDQEIVSYSNRHGSVSFDYLDLMEVWNA